MKKMEEVVGNEHNMRIYKTEHKVMVCDRDESSNTNLVVSDDILQDVIEFTYLGSGITNVRRNKK